MAFDVNLYLLWFWPSSSLFFCDLRILFDVRCDFESVFAFVVRPKAKITNLYEFLLSTDNLILFIFSSAHSGNLFPFLGYGNYRYSKLMRRFYFVVSLSISLSFALIFVFYCYLSRFVSNLNYWSVFLSSHSCVLSYVRISIPFHFIILFNLLNLAKESSKFNRRDLNRSSFMSPHIKWMTITSCTLNWKWWLTQKGNVVSISFHLTNNWDYFSFWMSEKSVSRILTCVQCLPWFGQCIVHCTFSHLINYIHSFI